MVLSVLFGQVGRSQGVESVLSGDAGVGNQSLGCREPWSEKHGEILADDGDGKSRHR